MVFYKRPPIYNPQGLIRLDKPVHHKGDSRRRGQVYSHGLSSDYVTEYINYPRNLLEIPCERGLHPTQKPVALFEYLIRTYTNAVSYTHLITGSSGALESLESYERSGR